jgi:hypothetical protein
MNFDEQDDFAALNKEIWDYVAATQNEEFFADIESELQKTDETLTASIFFNTNPLWKP